MASSGPRQAGRGLTAGATKQSPRQTWGGDGVACMHR